MTLTLEGRNVVPVVMQQCVDAATDRALQSKLTNVRQEACAKRDVQNSGDAITLDSVCKFGTFVVATHTVITGSFDNAYTARINSKREGDLPMPAGAQSVIGDRTIMVTGKWLGPCKADQKPRHHHTRRHKDERQRHVVPAWADAITMRILAQRMLFPEPHDKMLGIVVLFRSADAVAPRGRPD
ncbi:hypothetical protein JJC00_33285 [Bradyrhizobium diazoefficiens]|uniref:DUF3617 domain-containing protein n=1 Tax=Bradyrhizobium diazoefficiens TaxID=1355477 RepID=UPI00190D2BB3|nr:DUF3617 family protein [Bradyrhizobium diazoefficiens]QQO33344.1 hypothetical protein JJC00_33285 [Bradyrhizobium diazoefficiens]